MIIEENKSNYIILTLLGIFFVIILFIIPAIIPPQKPTGKSEREKTRLKSALIYLGGDSTKGKPVKIDSIIRIRTVGNAEVLYKERDYFTVLLRPSGYVVFRLADGEMLEIKNENRIN